MGLAGVYVQAVLLTWAGSPMCLLFLKRFFFWWGVTYVKSAAFSSIVMDNDWNTGGTV